MILKMLEVISWLRKSNACLGKVRVEMIGFQLEKEEIIVEVLEKKDSKGLKRLI